MEKPDTTCTTDMAMLQVVQAAYGDPLATYYYDAFGNILEQTGSINNSTTFAGYTYDKETGLYYLNARMYDPITARFLQEDTHSGTIDDPLSLNLYGYCSNEPVMYTDPTGHARGDIWDLRNFGENFNAIFGDPKETTEIINNEVVQPAKAAISDGAKYVGGVAKKATVGTYKTAKRLVKDTINTMGQVSSDAVIQGILNPLSYEAASVMNMTGVMNDKKYFQVADYLQNDYDQRTNKYVNAAKNIVPTIISNANDAMQLPRNLFDPTKTVDDVEKSLYGGVNTVLLATGVVGASKSILSTSKSLLSDLPTFGRQVITDERGSIRLLGGSAAEEVSEAVEGTSELSRMRVDKYGLTSKFDDIGCGTLGSTDPYGNIKIQRGLRGQEFKETYRHELVHKFFSPKTGSLKELRANVGIWGYKNSSLLRYTEEAIAEAYGSRNLLKGLKFPIKEGYVTPVDLLKEGAVVGGGVYLGYKYINDRMEGER